MSADGDRAFGVLLDEAHVLASASSPDAAAAALARLFVPAVADVAAVALAAPAGGERLAAFACRDAAVEAELGALVRDYVAAGGGQATADTLLAAGDAFHVAADAPSAFESMGAPAEAVALARRFGLAGIVIVPIVGRGPPLGHFGIASLLPDALGDLARRVAMALGQRLGLLLEQLALTEELRASELRYRALAEQTTAVVWRTDAAGRPLGDDGSWRRFTGRPATADAWVEQSHPDDRARVVEAWRRALAHPAPWTIGCRLMHADGGWRDVVVRGVPVRDETGAVREWIGTHTDVTAQRDAERAAAESHALLRSVLDTTPDAVYAKDRDGRFVMVNWAAAAVGGATPEEVVGRTDADYFDPPTVARIREEDRQVMREGVARTFEEVVELQGRREHYQTVRVPWRGPDGTLLGVVGVSRDVTRQREVEVAAARHTTALRAFFDAPGIDMCIFDMLPDGSDYVYTLPNPQMARFWGRTPEQLAGMTGRDVGLPARDIAWWMERFRECERRGSMAFEYSIDHPERGPTWHYAAMQAVELEAGRTSICFIATEVTERKVAEEEVRRSAERYRLVTDGLPVLVAFVDAEERFGLVNAAYERAVGRSRDALVGRRIVEVWGEAAYQQVRPHVRRALAGDAQRFEVDMPLPDGGLRRFDAAYIPSRDETGRVAGFFVMASDVTDRHSLEEQLRQAQKMEAVGRLAGGIAHDFNNLLTVIQASTAFARDEAALGQDPTPELDEVARAAARAAELTRQLLAFSRKQVVRREVVRVDDVVSHAERMLRRTIGEDVTLRLALSGDAWAELDRGQLEQALLNLVVNARDALPAGGTITIATGVRRLPAGAPVDLPAGDYVELSVSDTGHGMDDATRARVFEPFFTTKEPGRGTGLGLAMVYGIAAQQGGAVTVDSAPGQGATFRLFFPLAVRPTAEPRQAPSPSPRGGREQVLLVEDEQSVRALVRRALTSAGYEVTEAEHGLDALGKLDAGAPMPALVVTDVVMPRMGGPAMVEELRRRAPGLRVVYMSGYTADTALGLDAGGDAAGDAARTAFLAKPFDMSELLRRVRDLLDR